MTVYTVTQYLNELDARSRNIFKSNLVYLAATSIQAAYIDRIFTKGLDKNNRPHGLYSTKSTYINTKKKSPKELAPKGKTGNVAFASTGKKHKSTYFPRGYRQFKQTIGRGTKVNFRLFDDLKLDLTNGLRKLKTRARLVVKRKKNAIKIANLVDKYGRVSFMFTKKERENYLIKLTKLLNTRMSGNA